MEPTTKNPIFSILIPIKNDRGDFDQQVEKICRQLGGDKADCYEIIGIESPKSVNAHRDTDEVHGDVIIVIDGDLKQTPTTLSEVLGAFEKGSDMAFAGQYAANAKKTDEPELSYFAVRRNSLPHISESPEGQRLIVEVLGTDMIKRLIEQDDQSKHNYVFGHLRKMIGA